MFAHEDETLHSRSRGGANDLFGVKVSRAEKGGRFIAVTPLFVGEGVDGEMDEAVELHFMPAELSG